MEWAVSVKRAHTYPLIHPSTHPPHLYPQALLQMYVATMVVVTGAMFAFKGYIDRTFLKERDDRDAMDPLKKKASGWWTGVLIWGCYACTMTTSFTNFILIIPPLSPQKKKKGSMQENLALLTKSPKILNLALLVMCYSVAHRLFEFSWKGQLRTIYPTMIEYQSVLASVSIGTGWATMLMMLLGRFVFQYLGWGFAAQATPLVMLLSGEREWERVLGREGWAQRFFPHTHCHPHCNPHCHPILVLTATPTPHLSNTHPPPPSGGFFFISSLAPRLTSVLPLGGFDPTWLLTAGALAGCITQVFARSSKFSLVSRLSLSVIIIVDHKVCKHTLAHCCPTIPPPHLRPTAAPATGPTLTPTPSTHTPPSHNPQHPPSPTTPFSSTRRRRWYTSR